MEQQSSWTPNRMLALLLGILFVVFAVCGWLFTPRDGNLFTIFRDDVTRNTISTVTAVIALIAAYAGTNWSRLFNIVFGVVYLAWGILGFIPSLAAGGTLGHFVTINAVDNLFDLMLGAIALYLGLYVSGYTIHQRTAIPS